MLKETIKNIPILGPILLKWVRRIKGVPTFNTSGQYWEERYRKGGNSGAGSYDELAMFKAKILNQWVKEKKLKSVIEWGCGDGNQLSYFNFESYLGFDVSETVIALCRAQYSSDASKQFKLTKDFKGEKADLNLSLDVIYHLIEEAVYTSYMENLFASADQYVIIYASNYQEAQQAVAHVKHRKFTDWIEQYAPDFYLLQKIENDFPYDGNQEKTSIADFYIFGKKA